MSVLIPVDHVTVLTLMVFGPILGFVYNVLCIRTLGFQAKSRDSFFSGRVHLGSELGVALREDEHYHNTPTSPHWHQLITLHPTTLKHSPNMVSAWKAAGLT